MNIEYVAILREIVEKGKTGIIQAIRDDKKREIYFEKGVITYCKTSIENEKLINIISSLNYLDKTEAEIIRNDLIEKKTDNIKIGQKLVSDKIITPSQLYTALKYQAKIIALNIFKDKHLKIKLSENKQIKKIQNKLNISPVEILLQIYEYSVLDKKNRDLIKGKITNKKTPNSIMKTLLTEKEKTIFNNIKKGDDTNDIIKKDSLSERILFKLYILGLIEIDRNKKESSTKEEGISNDFLDEIKEYYELAVNKNYSTILKGKGEVRKRNYLKLVKKFHPDRLPPGTKKEIKEMVEIIFDAVNKAFANRDMIETKKEEETISDEELAIQTYRRAFYLFNNQKYSEVIRLIKNVLSYNKLNAKTRLLLAKAEAKIDTYKKDAEKDLLNLIQQEPWMKEAYHQLLLLYEEENLTTRAVPVIKKALQYFPNDETFLGFSEKLLKPKKKKFFPF